MKINFFGDIVASQATKNLSLSNNVKELLRSAHVNIINYEAPSFPNANKLSPIKKSGPTLHQTPEISAWLEENGFMYASLSNNHIMDYGDKGLAATIKSFHHIHSFGAGTWENAYKPCKFELEGKKVALFALSHCEFGTLTDRWDKRYTQGTAWINHPEIEQIITKTRKEVDILLIFAHAGMENIPQPLPEWRDRYRSFIDMGCDGVIASHPHIAQGWEIYKDKPIVYSLGNFYFPKLEKKQDYWYKSLCASIVLDNDKIHLEITPLKFYDTNIDIDTSEEFKQYLVNVNKVLSNNELYIKEINETCIRLLDVHYRLFEAGGLIQDSYHKLLKVLIKKIIGRKKSSKVHLINNLWCESHRFLICRALKLTNDIR